jgi:hypothetical protein
MLIQFAPFASEFNAPLLPGNEEVDTTSSRSEGGGVFRRDSNIPSGQIVNTAIVFLLILSFWRPMTRPE